jgi:hypothetical protein
MKLRVTLAAVAALFSMARPAHAEAIQLLDNTQVSGKEDGGAASALNLCGTGAIY